MSLTVGKPDYISYGYGLAVAAGGIMGYLKARSIPSLAAGLIFGSLATIGAYQISQDQTNLILALGTSTVLLAMMGSRFYRTKKFMPAGLIAGLSLLQASRLSFSLIKK